VAGIRELGLAQLPLAPAVRTQTDDARRHAVDRLLHRTVPFVAELAYVEPESQSECAQVRIDAFDGGFVAGVVREKADVTLPVSGRYLLGTRRRHVDADSQAGMRLRDQNRSAVCYA
jgi:hypothetical protein